MGSKRRFHTLQILCVILAFWPHFSLSLDPQPCNMTVVVGESVTIPLQYSQFKEGDELIWKHGDKTIFEKKRTVIIGRKEDVTNIGSLILHSVQMSHAGMYSGQVYNSTTGHNLYETVTNLCVRGELVYGFIQEDVQLHPKKMDTINSITWKKQEDKIAEWDKNSELYYYKRCRTKDQCDLKITTGVLVMKGLKREDEGRYSAEINEKTFQHEFQLIVLDGRTKKIYESAGKHVKLDPKVNKTINSINWKKQNDKVAEWDQTTGHNYYGRCLTGGQCELNPTTGVLIMKGLKQEDEGQYFAEINRKAFEEDFLLTVVEPVSKPKVARHCSDTNCLLVCVGEETKHLKYSWKENNETVNEENTLTVHKSGDQSKSYTCVASNFKSKKESDPLTELDLFPGPGSKASSPGPPVGYIAAGVLMPLFLMVVEL